MGRLLKTTEIPNYQRIQVPQSMAVILCEIADERARQDAKHGNQFNKPLDRHLAVIAEEFGEVAMAVNDIDAATDSVKLNKLVADLRMELVQTAACCVKMLEAMNAKEALAKHLNGIFNDQTYGTKAMTIDDELAAQSFRCDFGRMHLTSDGCDCYM